MFYGIPGADPRLWDPATGTTAALPLPRPGYNLFCSGHTFLADGRLFFAGGHIDNSVGPPNASTYDAAANVWAPGPNMNAGRWYPTTTTLANGDVVVVSGDVNTVVGVNLLPQVFQASSGTSGTWRDLTNALLNLDLYPWMHLARNGKVFNAGPSQTTRYLDTSGTGAWTPVATRTSGYRDYGSSVMYDDGKVLVMGGGDPPTRTAAVIDLNAATPSWQSAGSMAFARRQLNATLLPNGKVLVTGGTYGPGFNNLSTPVYAAEIWDPTEGWTTMASAQTPRLYHSAALLLPNGRVLTTGGDNQPEVEVYSPPYLFAPGPRPTIASAPAAVSYGQSFFVETPDAASIAKVTWIRLSSVTHAFNQNQRINRLSFTQAAGGLNVVPPSNPNLAPPGHYMLFLLNGNDVPSVARIVRLTPGTTVAAVLPLSRSHTLGSGVPPTAFAAMINSGAAVAANCRPATPLSPPAGLGPFAYQTTNSSNALTGTPNTPANIAPGATQNFVFGFDPTGTIPAGTSLAMRFPCDNVGEAAQIAGVNNFIIGVSATPVPDPIAQVSTLSGDGVVRIPGPADTQLFAIGTSNVGATGVITVSADTGGVSLPLTLTVCETTGGSVCLAPPTSSVTMPYGAGENRSFAFFATSSGSIAFLPQTNRVFPRLKEGSDLRGAASAAVCTKPNAGC